MKCREEAWQQVDDLFGQIFKNAPPLAIQSKVMDGDYCADVIKDDERWKMLYKAGRFLIDRCVNTARAIPHRRIFKYIMANTPKGVDGKNTIGKQVYISILHVITAAAVDVMELQQTLFDVRDADSVMAYEEAEGNEEHYPDSEDEYDEE